MIRCIQDIQLRAMLNEGIAQLANVPPIVGSQLFSIARKLADLYMTGGGYLPILETAVKGIPKLAVSAYQNGAKNGNLVALPIKPLAYELVFNPKTREFGVRWPDHSTRR